MAYEKKTWKNKEEIPESELSKYPRFDAANMNRLEDGISEAFSLVGNAAPSGHGLGTASASFQDRTLSDMMQEGCGFYQVKGAADTPSNETSWINLLQSSRGTTDGKSTGFQLAAYDFYKNKPQIWFRTMVLNQMSEWSEMIHTGNLSRLGIPTIVSSSYVGAGIQTVNGVAIPTSLTINTPHKVQMLTITDSSPVKIGGILNYVSGASVTFIRHQSQGSTNYARANFGDTVAFYTTTWSDNTVSWINTDNLRSSVNKWDVAAPNPEYQFCVAQRTYYYTAFCW